jgi:hypothetical protein
MNYLLWNIIHVKLNQDLQIFAGMFFSTQLSPKMNLAIADG